MSTTVETQPGYTAQRRTKRHTTRSTALVVAAFVAIAAVVTVLAFVSGHTVTGKATPAPGLEQQLNRTLAPPAGSDAIPGIGPASHAGE